MKDEDPETKPQLMSCQWQLSKLVMNQGNTEDRLNSAAWVGGEMQTSFTLLIDSCMKLFSYIALFGIT